MYGGWQGFGAGDLSFSRMAYAGMTITLTDSFDTGFIPFTFGQPFVLPIMSAGLIMECIEVCSNSTASESITSFDIRTAAMQPIPGAYVDLSPDPASFMLTGCGLVALSVIVGRVRSREHRKACSRICHLRWFALVAVALVFHGISHASVIGPNDTTEIAQYLAHGSLLWDNSWIYNGQPTSPSNYPSAYELDLSSLITLYESTSASNTLYVTATDVVSTHFGYTFGATFADLTITGIAVSGGFPFDQPFTYSGDYAVSGEALQGTISGNCSDSTTVPLTSTPSWSATAQASGVNIHTVNGEGNGLTAQWGCIYGGFRIVGGAAFALSFGDGIDVGRLNPDALSVSVQYGGGYESIAGVLQTQTPEPRTFITVPGLTLMAYMLRRVQLRRKRGTGEEVVRALDPKI
jgi:hypothetical protein